jgi:hypothetical protein
VFVDGAALRRHGRPEGGERVPQTGRTIDDEQLGRSQPASDQIVEQRPPGGLALAAHALNRQQHLLAVSADAEDDQKGDAGGLPVEPDADDRPVEDQPHDRLGGEIATVPGLPAGLDLAPRAAHDVLADRPAEERREGAAYPARVGAGEVGRGDQRLGGLRATLVGPECLAPPLDRPAALGRDAGARHAQLGRPEGACQGARPAAVPVTDGLGRHARAALARRPSRVARPGERRVQLARDHRLDELANPIPQGRLDRVEPVGKERPGLLGLGLHGIPLRGRARHGVVSSPARQCRGRWVGQPGDYATLIPTNLATAPVLIPARRDRPDALVVTDNLGARKAEKARGAGPRRPEPPPPAVPLAGPEPGRARLVRARGPAAGGRRPLEGGAGGRPRPGARRDHRPGRAGLVPPRRLPGRGLTRNPL